MRHTKGIKVSDRTKKIILLEAFRQGLKKGKTVTQGDVLGQLAKKLNTKYNFVK